MRRSMASATCWVARGSRQALPIGSHSHTQPIGGWLDGALGVIYAPEVPRCRHHLRVHSISDALIPSLGGISHDFAEDSREEDIVLGCQVLADSTASILVAAKYR